MAAPYPSSQITEQQASRLSQSARRALSSGDPAAAYRCYTPLLGSVFVTPQVVLEACGALEQMQAAAEWEAVARRGVRLFPDQQQLWVGLGRACQRLGRGEQALSAYQEAIRRAPRSAHAWAGIAQVYEQTHQLDAALEAIDRAVASMPGSYYLVHCRGVILRRLKRYDQAAADQQQVLQRSPQADATSRHLAWCEIGRIARARGDITEAKRAIKAAKSAQEPLRQPYLAAWPDYQRQINRRFAGLDRPMVERWTARRATGPTSATRAGALIVGHPRSGTTLLQQVVAAHPQAVTLDEFEALPHAEATVFGPHPSIECLDSSSDDQARRLLGVYRQEADRYLGEPAGDRLLVDKRPDSLLMLPTVLRVMPDARILVMIRDPRDVCVSCYEQTLALGPVSAQFGTLASASRYYAWFMSHWLRLRDLLPAAIWQEVRYETLVDDFDLTVRSALAFLGLDWDPSVADFHQKTGERLVSTPSYTAVSSPFSRGAIGRWRDYADELEPCMSTLAPMLDAFGYAD